MDDLFAISSWQEQLNGIGKHSWNSIGNNFEYGSNAYHCSTINNTNDLSENKCCNHASRASSMAPYLTGRDSVEKESLLSPNEHQDLLMYDHRNIMHQYDPLLSAQVNHFDKHQAVSAAGVSSRPFMTGPMPETTLPIEPSYISKQLWSDEAAPWRRHRALDASNRGQGRVEMRVGQHSQPQINSTMANGNVKPRTRARRGQATDPHSIAERHRRERIADGMKKLQELVPNVSKVDKGSMLDDIISYVKFLRLQATVLNLNKLGSTGAAAPLIAADICSDEICHQHQIFPESPIFSGQSSVEAGMAANTNADYNSKIIKAEEEFVKLMEVDISSAMRFLQKKGLCLMPISLAAVISSKDSSSACSTDAKER